MALAQAEVVAARTRPSLLTSLTNERRICCCALFAGRGSLARTDSADIPVRMSCTVSGSVSAASLVSSASPTAIRPLSCWI